MSNHSMPLLGGPMHGVTSEVRRVVEAFVPEAEHASEHDAGVSGRAPRRGIYAPVRYAMCGRMLTVGIWEDSTDVERDDLMWEYLASDAAKALVAK